MIELVKWMFEILWMEEILHHQKDGWNPINDGINHLSTGAGFRHPPYVWDLIARVLFHHFSLRKNIPIGIACLAHGHGEYVSRDSGGFGATCPEGKVLMQPSLACWTTTMGHINSRSTNIRLPENKVLPNLMVNDLFPNYRVVIFGVYPHVQTHQTLWNSQFAQVKSPCLMVISSKSTKWGFLFFRWFNQTSAGQHVFLGVGLVSYPFCRLSLKLIRWIPYSLFKSREICIFP